VLDGYVIDIIKSNGLIEIQTKNFPNIRAKLKKLLCSNNITLVHNIPAIKWLIKMDAGGNVVSKRKSTKKGTLYHLFDELIYLTDIVTDPKFTLEIVITEEEETRQDDGRGSWRRKGVSIKDRRLIRILEKRKIATLKDYFTILPENLPEPFSTKDIAGKLKIRSALARKVVYFFKKTGLLQCVAKKGNLLLYKRVSNECPVGIGKQ
jgi:hypothetical protein